WAAVMRLNVEGTMTMTEAALPALRAAGGMVVNVTVSPHHGMPAMAHTGAARAAVEVLTRSLSEREPDVAFVAAAIGRFDTESLPKYRGVVLRGGARSVPPGRRGGREGLGWLIAMRATPAGRALDGTVVTLDGGADNWTGPWPPPNILDEEGAVPTEER